MSTNAFPIGTIHHLSATGGTIISKCLAALPDMVLLSEINPQNYGSKRFDPFDPLGQFLARYPNVADTGLDSLREIFFARLAPVVERCKERGLRLIIRDHAHSDFLGKHPREPALRTFLAGAYNVTSVVTVRNPVEAFLSLREHEWHGSIGSFDNYCARVLMFLSTYSDCPLFHYEDFVEDPDRFINDMCLIYGLQFDLTYSDRAFAMRMSGDSGRARFQQHIRRLPVREFDASFRSEVLASANYHRLCERFGYDRDPQDLARRVEKCVLAHSPLDAPREARPSISKPSASKQPPPMVRSGEVPSVGSGRKEGRNGLPLSLFSR